MKNYKGIVKATAMLFAFQASMFTLSSCQDFFDVEPSHVIDAGTSHLDNANDTIYSLTGILNKMQAIADRTVLLGEARGDLVDITDVTSKDLREVAQFAISEKVDSNKYNSPRDYYAIINNCNYYIHNVDTSKVDSHNSKIFLNEYAAIKAIRAWVYLQLALNYGEVPFYTTPITTMEQMEVKDTFNIKQICNYFINDDGLKELAAMDAVTYPNLGNIKGTPSRLFYFPLEIVLGDLNLWSDNYTEAAKYYHKYLVERNGEKDCYPTQVKTVMWPSNDWGDDITPSDSWSQTLLDESNGKYSEVISIIPMDSVASEGYYGELRSIFNSSFAKDNDYRVSLVPSQSLKDLSAAQKHVYYNPGDNTLYLVPTGLDNYRTGDLRLQAVWQNDENGYTHRDGTKSDYQTIKKFSTKNGNVHIYRRSQVYLRYAEAMNRAGYPFYAYMILANGINHDIMTDTICNVYKADSTYLINNFDFPENAGHYVEQYYPMFERMLSPSQLTEYQTYSNIGIHAHGSGWAGFADYAGAHGPYPMPEGTLQEQMDAVEDMIMDECALEMAFEGTRFYDLMRVALRRNNPAYLANKIKARRGEGNDSGITVDLTNTRNWYMRYDGKIGVK